ncbi:GNAT family N-acetyltransferase [Demequina capsici]|uniref:GNAT family N-acetyltransferase n=1 Tax=Demequina capsici TaxID=3075620 RepID=A0AA96JAL9_9MICO|nr:MULTISPECIES: GNAT family N-acetyltransferase [unclassified Demequina]WNM24326.1 GNAT family N-acetyltransferase [Demequina sp. OYTSA14]WNM27148.1 GNAT family N-acetyltransferase [Demequina sp. PMTSA13]
MTAVTLETDPTVRIVPASQARREDLDAIFDAPGDQRSCRCQWTRLASAEYRTMTAAARAEALAEQAGCDRGGDAASSGLIAFVDGEPAGWVAVEPRTVYRRFRTARIPWLGRDEDKDDDGVWVVSCFVVRRGFRGRGLMAVLAAAAVAHSAQGGARAVEGYPVVLDPAKGTYPGELYVGTVGAFEAAGMTEVAAPSARRRVMRIQL